MARPKSPAAWILLLVAASLAGCGGPPEATSLWENAVLRQAVERKRLVVALEAEFPPMESRDDAGNIVGFDVDLARAIGRELGEGVEVEFRDVKWDNIVAELTTGKADLIVSGMTATPERALTVSFTDPYYRTITCLLVAKAREGEVRSFRDLDRPDRTISVKLGTTGETAARKRCPKARLVVHENENSAAMEVALGRADAFLYDLASVRNHHRQHPDATFLIEEPVSVEPYSIALRKGDPESVAWLNLVLDHMRRDGRLEELYVRHGLEPSR